MYESCSECRLDFVNSPGDLWAFWVIGDRIFIGFLFLALFVIVRPTDWQTGVTLFLVTMVPLVITIPHRMGIAVGLDYLTRRHLDTQ